MARPARTAPPVSPDSQQSLVRYCNETLRLLGKNYNFRTRMVEIDKIYQRETDLTPAQLRAKAANRNGDASKMQNVVIPVVMPQVEACLTELSEIFLASYPIFPVVSKPQMQDTALQMETIVGEHSIRFGWHAELLQVLRDGLKYGIMACEVGWETKKVYSLVNDAATNVMKGTPEETLFSGNAVRRVNPYNLIVDTRVPPFEVHKRGEYVGYTDVVSRIELKQMFAELDPTKTMNAREAFESGMAEISTSSASNGYFIPQVNSQALVTPQEQIGTGNTINWHAWAGLEDANSIRYADVYEKTVLYARLIPKEHKIYGDRPSIPQIYKLIIINRKVLVYAERLSNAHNYLPILVAQPLEDGLSWQTKSFADNAAPFQALASSLYNSGIESQRRKVYDRMLYDPSRVNKADIDNTSPIARIAVKSEAYGKPVSEAVYQIPYRDDNVSQIFGVGQQILQMADIANGTNRVQQGQFQKGNKTRHEFEDVMDSSRARPRMMALVLESRFFTPLKEIIKTNILQFQQPGNLYNRNTKGPVAIDPVQMRQIAAEFQLADGLIQSDQYVNMELFKTILNMVAQNPAMAQRWDILGMVMYWMKLEGATWIDDFDTTKQQPNQQALPNATPQPQPTAAAGPTPVAQ